MIRKLTAKNPFAGIGERTPYEFYKARQKTLLKQIASKEYLQLIIDSVHARASGPSGTLNPNQVAYVAAVGNDMLQADANIEVCKQNIKLLFSCLTPEDQAEELLTKLSSD